MREYPLDIRGLILRHLQPEKEYRWVAPFLWDGSFEVEDYLSENQSIRKYQVLIEVDCSGPVSYTHLRAHETVLDLVCRLLLE